VFRVYCGCICNLLCLFNLRERCPAKPIAKRVSGAVEKVYLIWPFRWVIPTLKCATMLDFCRRVSRVGFGKSQSTISSTSTTTGIVVQLGRGFRTGSGWARFLGISFLGEPSGEKLRQPRGRRFSKTTHLNVKNERNGCTSRKASDLESFFRVAAPSNERVTFPEPHPPHPTFFLYLLSTRKNIER